MAQFVMIKNRNTKDANSGFCGAVVNNVSSSFGGPE